MSALSSAAGRLRRPTAGRAVVAGLVLALASARVMAPSRAAASEGGPDLAAATSVREFDESLRTAFAEAFRAIETGDKADGFDKLLRALAHCSDQVATYGQVTFLNQKHAAILRLLDQGPDVRAAFESAYSERAAEALADGLRRRDARALLASGTLFLPTESGQKAFVAAADLLAEEGRVPEAAERLRQLLWFVPPEALRVDPARVVARLARAAIASGDATRLEALAAWTRAHFPKLEAESIAAGGRRATIAELLARRPAATTEISNEDWPAFGGSNERRFAAPALEIADGARLEPVWIYRHRTTLDPELPSPSPPDESTPTVFSSRENPILPVFPVVAEGTIYFADRSAAFAVDVDSGLTRWVTEFAAAAQGAGASEKRPLAHRRRPYHYVTLAASRTLLVMPTDLAVEGLAPSRTLLRLDGATGAVTWRAAASPDDDDGADFLRRAILTGPPLVVGDTVFTGGRLTEVETKAYVVAFSLADGRLLWRTFLASGPETERRDERGPDSAPEPETPSLSESGGVIYVSTDLGVIAAVDSATGDPLWIYRPTRLPDLLFESRDHWRDDPLAIVGDRIHSTPPGSDKVRLVFARPERGTGHIENEHWDKNDLDFLLAADAGDLYLVGRDEEDRNSVLVAYHPADPEKNEQWRFPVPNPSEKSGGRPLDRPLGRGLVTQTRVLLPTWKALYELDRPTGRVAAVHSPAVDAETRMPLPFGNLVPVGRDRLLAAGPRHLVLYRIAR